VELDEQVLFLVARGGFQGGDLLILNGKFMLSRDEMRSCSSWMALAIRSANS